MFLSLSSLLVGTTLTYTAFAIPQRLQDRSYSCAVDKLLSKLHDPTINSLASSFCSTYIRTTKTVPATATATSITSTTTIAPGTTSTIISATTTTTDLSTTFTTQAPDDTTTLTATATVTLTTTTSVLTMKRRGKRNNDQPPWFFYGYLTSQISSACTCLITTVPQLTKTQTATTVTVSTTVTSVQPGPTSATTTSTTETDTVTLDFTTTLPPTQTDPTTTTVTSTVPTATTTIICGARGDVGGSGSNANSYRIPTTPTNMPAPLGSQCLNTCMNLATCLSYTYFGNSQLGYYCSYFNATASVYVKRNPTGQSYFYDLGCPPPPV